VRTLCESIARMLGNALCAPVVKFVPLGELSSLRSAARISTYPDVSRAIADKLVSHQGPRLTENFSMRARCSIALSGADGQGVWGHVVKLTGTASDFDSDGPFGLIDADDGRVLVFNLSATPWAIRPRCRIGIRVRFEPELTRSGRAIAPVPMSEAADGARRSMPQLDRGAGRP